MSRENQIEVIARAVLVQNDKILLCKVKDAKWYFLPGGHVEYGEPSEFALIRELKEECNIDNVHVDGLLGLIENKFPVEDRIQHEISMFFKVKSEKEVVIDNQETHIEYEFVKLGELDSVKLLPETLKESLLKWIDKKELFWNPMKD
ncbi:MAG: NUDIX domain-containing protein [Proteobacteria bacterium]|nr:NUDIX domain-containing protein [Pseudomonadota bacterium]